MASKDLVGSVFERKPSSPSSVSNIFTRPTGTGFPSVQHRSKSAFARAREQRRQQSNVIEQPQSQSTSNPSVISTQRAEGRASDMPPAEIRPSLVVSSNNDDPNESSDWRAQMSSENEAKVANMTEEEREEERRQIFEQFGPGIADILRRARERLERTVSDADEQSRDQNCKLLRKIFRGFDLSPVPRKLEVTRALKSTLMQPVFVVCLVSLAIIVSFTLYNIFLYDHYTSYSNSGLH
jgi:hypothetical protein